MSEQMPESENEQPQETLADRILRKRFGIDPSEEPEHTVIDLHSDTDDPSIQ